MKQMGAGRQRVGGDRFEVGRLWPSLLPLVVKARGSVKGMAGV